MPDPKQDPHLWLQRIRDIQLTLAGCDRARGTVIRVPHPRSDEDDERITPGSSLEAIATAISDEYSDSQVARFLLESGIPSEHADQHWDGDRAEYVLGVLDQLASGGSANRRALRSFIGGLLDGRLQFQPDPTTSQRLISQFARQGWHVRDGVLVIGERTKTPAPPTALARESRRFSLHPAIRQVAARYLDAGQLEVAVLEAFKAVIKRVKELSGLDMDGSDLMAKAFNGNPPPIELGDPSTNLGRDVQEGYRFMFIGAIRAIRNRDAHQPFRPLSEEETFEELGLISLLLRRLDAAASSTRTT